MKKACVFLIAAMAGWTTNVDAQYTTIDIGNHSFTTGPGINVTSTRIGSSTFSSGTVGRKRYNTTTTRIGNHGFTTGRLGSNRFNSTFMRIGSFMFGW